MASSLEFTFTLISPVQINHCKCWNPINTSLKLHSITYLCEVLRFWISSLVTHLLLSIALNSSSIWLCKIYLWVGMVLFESYLMYNLSTGLIYCQTGLYSVNLSFPYLSLSSWQWGAKAKLFPCDVSMLCRETIKNSSKPGT